MTNPSRIELSENSPDENAPAGSLNELRQKISPDVMRTQVAPLYVDSMRRERNVALDVASNPGYQERLEDISQNRTFPEQWNIDPYRTMA